MYYMEAQIKFLILALYQLEKMTTNKYMNILSIKYKWNTLLR